MSPRSAAQSALQVAGAVMLLLSLSFGLFLGVRYSNSAASDWAVRKVPADERTSMRQAGSSLVLPDSLGDIAVPAPGNADPHLPIAQSKFSLAYARLDRALRAHPSETPDRLLKAANERSKARKSREASHPCPITWNGGEPSLLLQNRNGGLALPDALNGCAAAIEALP